MPYGDGPCVSLTEVIFIDGADDVDEVAVIGCESRGVPFVDASVAAFIVAGACGEPEKARGATEPGAALIAVVGGIVAADWAGGCGVAWAGEDVSVSLSLSSAMMPAGATKDSFRYHSVGFFVEAAPTELCCHVLRRSDELGYRLHMLNIPDHE